MDQDSIKNISRLLSIIISAFLCGADLNMKLRDIVGKILTCVQPENGAVPLQIVS